MVGRKKATPTSEFGLVVSQLLDKKAASSADLMGQLDFSASHSYNVLRGTKTATPGYVTAVAAAINATPAETQRLTVAAARDNGFDLKLPEDW